MSKGHTFWFTGLSGAGKSTIAELVKTELESLGKSVCILDGDAVRAKHEKPLGFTKSDIGTNNRLIVDMCLEKRSQFDLILVPVISPYKEFRLEARQRLEPHFSEVHIKSDLETVMERDTKGLYQKARDGHITNMIGYNDSNPYEAPESPELEIDTSKSDLKPEDSAKILLKYISEVAE